MASRYVFKESKWTSPTEVALPNFLPTSVPIFTTINDTWNEYKIETLRKIGYEVISLWEDRNKEYNGIKIRELIVNGDDS